MSGVLGHFESEDSMTITRLILLVMALFVVVFAVRVFLSQRGR